MTETLTIRDIRVRPVIAPLARPMTTASGSIPAAPLVLIDIESDQGVVGRSYIFAYTPKMLAPLVSLFGELRDGLIGASAAPVERYAAFETGFRLLGRQGLLGMVISGLDMAFWDMQARAQERPLVELLGGSVRPVRAYDSYGFVDPKRDEAQLRASLDKGFRAIKVKVGYPELRDDAANIRDIRSAIGPDVALMVDFNQSLSVPEAIRRIDAIAEHDILWVEEPVPAEDVAGHVTVRAASPVAIQTGENWWFPEDATRAVTAEACDYAMPDLMKIGGVTGWQRAAGLLAGASIPVSSHLFVEASAHVLPVTPGAHYLEFADFAATILKEPMRIEDGCVVPRGPGLGLEWDEASVGKHAA